MEDRFVRSNQQEATRRVQLENPIVCTTLSVIEKSFSYRLWRDVENQEQDSSTLVASTRFQASGKRRNKLV